MLYCQLSAKVLDVEQELVLLKNISRPKQPISQTTQTASTDPNTAHLG